MYVTKQLVSWKAKGYRKRPSPFSFLKYFLTFSGAFMTFAGHLEERIGVKATILLGDNLYSI